MTTKRLLALVLVLAACVWFGWKVVGVAPDAAARDARDDIEAREGAAELERVGTDGARTAAPGDPKRASLRPDTSGLSLEERLAAIARLEGELLQGGADESGVLRLEGLLEPLLASPKTLISILDNLVAGMWKQEEEPTLVSVVEYGGCRSLYWALVSFHNPKSEHFDAEQGRELFLTILTALPQLDGKLLELLIEQITRAEVDGKPLVSLYALEILELRAYFREKKALFSRLFARLGEAMTPEERDRFFTVYLSDTTDPLLIGTALRNLLQGANPDWALALAESLFDDPTTAAEVKKAIAQAVAEGMQDPFKAAEFLIERIDTTRGIPGVWFSLAGKEGGFAAAEAAYNHLAGADANSKAREQLVASMRNAPAADLERLVDIAFQDSDPNVRGQALMSLTSSPHWAPTASALGDLKDVYAGGADPLRTAWSAGNIANKAAKIGDTALRDGATEFLTDMVLDESLTDSVRYAALEQLKPFLSDVEWELLKKGISK